jgi:serine/threonine protein phosphatase 1
MGEERPSTFATLRAARRVWAIASVHGDAARLRALHARIARRVQPGDRLVYLGNVIGVGPESAEAVDEVLRFRLAFLARFGAFAPDVALLRGAQEEMWQRLLQLQFAVNPREVLAWLIDNGCAATVESYGGDLKAGESAVRAGAAAITRWTGQLRDAFQKRPGHQNWQSALSHAAFTDDGGLLLVHRGLAPDRPLDAQADVFWWGARAFDNIDTSYGGFRRVVRGFDPAHRGVTETPWTLSLDAGCGFGGKLAAACIAADGAVVEVVEV